MDSLLAPLVGVGTAAAAYLGWVLLHRLLPAPFNSMHKLWFLASVALGLVGYWMVPCEGRYASPDVQAWHERQPALATHAEWLEYGKVWREMSALSPSSAGVNARLDAIGERLPQATAGLAALQERGVLAEAEVRALNSLALQRHAYLRSWASRPGAAGQNLWEGGMAALETRLRFLNLVLDVPESDRMLWQQRVRLARELAMIEQFEAAKGDADLLKSGGPCWPSVAPHHRSLALLVVDLSVSPPEAKSAAAPACGTPGETCDQAQQSACQSSGMGSCGTEKPAAPAAGGCCGR